MADRASGREPRRDRGRVRDRRRDHPDRAGAPRLLRPPGSRRRSAVRRHDRGNAVTVRMADELRYPMRPTPRARRCACCSSRPLRSASSAWRSRRSARRSGSCTTRSASPGRWRRARRGARRRRAVARRRSRHGCACASLPGAVGHASPRSHRRAVGRRAQRGRVVPPRARRLTPAQGGSSGSTARRASSDRGARDVGGPVGPPRRRSTRRHRTTSRSCSCSSPVPSGCSTRSGGPDTDRRREGAPRASCARAARSGCPRLVLMAAGGAVVLEPPSCASGYGLGRRPRSPGCAEVERARTSGGAIAVTMPGGTELIIILFIVLLLFGARRLPDLAAPSVAPSRSSARPRGGVDDGGRRLRPSDGTEGPTGDRRRA
jgi:sec-independent protein translocase protein TatA